MLDFDDTDTMCQGCKLGQAKLFTLTSTVISFTVADPGFSQGGAPNPKSAIIFQFFAKTA